MEAMAVTVNDSIKPAQFICISCRAHYDIVRLDIDEDHGTVIPNFCPNCGLRIVDIQETIEYKRGEKVVK